MRRSFYSLALGAGLLVGTSPAGAQIVNGGFEQPGCNSYTLLNGGSSAISGWTTTNEGVEWFNPAIYGWSPAGGVCVVDLAWYTSSGVPGGGISQLASTVNGGNYTLNFFGATVQQYGRGQNGSIELWLNGTLAQTFTVSNTTSTLSASQWQSFAYTFTANGATNVEFRNEEDAYTHFAFLDDVSMTQNVVQSTATPEPATITLFASGLLGLGGIGWRRRRNRSA